MEPDPDLGLSSATELAARIRRGALSSRELLEHYLGRIERLNPSVNAVVTIDADSARRAAAAADEAFAHRADDGDLGPLHGLPTTIKDAIATAGMRSTGGATELADHVPTHDAPAVAKLRDAGAVVFGKTNLPRWSGDAQSFNTMFGTTNNPWDLTRGPGGSSGGAAAAVSVGMTSFELGTDIGGSVRLPAHFAGVCGHKPSFGVIPQLGYLDHRAATAAATEADVNVFGPLARSVADLELLLDVLAGPTPDRATAWSLRLPAARHDSLEAFRVAAWLDDATCPVSQDVAALLEQLAGGLERAGATVDRAARPGIDLQEVWDTGIPLIAAATSPARTDEEWARLVASAAEADEPGAPPAAIRARGSVQHHRDWLLLDERRHVLRRRWAAFFQQHDILLCPVAAMAAFPHDHEGNLYSRSLVIDGVERPYADVLAWTSFIGFVHLPSTVVPIGLTPGGLPVGVQIVAPFLEDRTALRFARFVEALTGGYRPPPLATAPA
ncbi:MAG: amidase [Acidimicrobiales bacterium]|nr:amidase [Acidimicrobiales bacterium]